MRDRNRHSTVAAATPVFLGAALFLAGMLAFTLFAIVRAL